MYNTVLIKGFLFFVFVVSFVSCIRTNYKIIDLVDDNGVIVISIDMNNIQDLDISILADSVHFVKLETTDEGVIGNIRKVIFFEERYFIHESKTSSILVFNNFGRYLYKFGSRGRGPGEFVSLSRVLLDEEKKTLMIYDVDFRKMLYYTLDGKFIKEITNFSDGAVIRDIYNLPDGRFICYTPDLMDWSGIWLVDSFGKPERFLIKQNIEYPITHTFESYFNPLTDGIISLWCPDVDDIFHFSDTTACKYLSMKLNKKTVSDYPNRNIRDNINLMRKIKVFEKEKFLMTIWNDGDSPFLFTSIFIKEENKTILTRKINSGKNNIDAIIARNVDYNVPNQMLHVIYASTVYDRIQNDDLSENRKKMLSSMFSKEIEENPLLEIFYLK